MKLTNRTRAVIQWPVEDPIVKINLATLDGLMNARYLALIRQMREWFEERSNDRLSEIDDWDEAQVAEHATALNFVVTFAQNVASIESVEQENAAGEWVTIPIPGDWMIIDGYLENIPPDLSTIWNEQALRINPGLWNIDESKSGQKKDQDNEST